MKTADVPARYLEPDDYSVWTEESGMKTVFGTMNWEANRISDPG